jgi:hypothetical protein
MTCQPGKLRAKTDSELGDRKATGEGWGKARAQTAGCRLRERAGGQGRAGSLEAPALLLS